jgi:hypothetical protein
MYSHASICVARSLAVAPVFLKDSLVWPISCSMQPSITIKITPAALQLLRFIAAMRRKTHYKVLEHLLQTEAQRLLKRKRR